MAAAENAGARVLLGFSHSRSRFKRVRKTLPSPRRFRREFLRFRARYPFIKDVPDLERGEPSRPADVEPPRSSSAATTTSCATTAAACTIVGPSVLDSTKMPGWVKRVEKAAKHRIGIWAIHNYIDANRFRTRGTRSLLRATKAKIWFTETGGLVRRDNGSTIEFAESPQARGEGDEVGAQARPPEPARPARSTSTTGPRPRPTPPGTRR